MIKTFIKGIIKFITDRETILEVLILLARKLFGEEAVDFTICEVKAAELRFRDGKERFEYVKGKLLAEIKKFQQNAKKKRFWINFVIELIVAYLSEKGVING